MAPLETDGFEAFRKDIRRMAQHINADDTVASTAKAILPNAAQPILDWYGKDK